MGDWHDQARERIEALGLEPGDVILTGNSAAVSRAIQLATGCQVSHVMTVVDGGLVAEATEFRRVANDRSGGVYLHRLDEALDNPDLDHVIVRRPTEIDRDRFLHTVGDFLTEQPRYGSSGLLFSSALLMLGRSWPNGVADLLLGDEQVEDMTNDLLAVIADGEQRVVCSEFAYRALHGGRVRLRHPDLLFSHLAAGLPEPPEDTEDRDEDEGTDDDRGDVTLEELHQSLERAARRPEPRGVESVIDRFGWVAYARLANRQLRRAYRTRQSQPGRSDIADLVTPRDFVAMEPFRDLLELSREGR